MKTYYTHDNGGRPFKVVFDTKNKQCKVFKELGEPDKYDNVPIKIFTYEKVFIGKSPVNQMTKFSGGYGTKFDGNSILLHIKDRLYVFIGESIFQFYSDEIKKFVSPVGNNDVPYPYAITENDEIHLFLNGVTIQKQKDYGKFSLLNDVLKNHLKTDMDNPYEYFYVPQKLPVWHRNNRNKLSQEEYKTVMNQYKKTIKSTKIKGKKILVARVY